MINTLEKEGGGGWTNSTSRHEGIDMGVLNLFK